jgi:hypothetical protein
MICTATSWAAPSAATTTRTARTTRSLDRLGERGRTPAGVHPQADRFRHRHQVFQPARFFTGRPVTAPAAATRCRPGLVHPDGRQMTGDDWGNDFAGGPRCSSTARASASAAIAPAARRHARSCSASTPHGSPRSSPCPAETTGRSGKRWSWTPRKAPSPDSRRSLEAGEQLIAAGAVADGAGQDQVDSGHLPGRRCARTSTSKATAGLVDYLATLGCQPPLHRAAARRDPRLHARVRRGRSHPGEPETRWRQSTDAAGAKRCARPGWAWWRHRAQPRRRRRAVRQPGVVGRAASTGRASAYADHFDIDWHGCAAGGRLLVPVLGRRPPTALRPARSTAPSCGTSSSRYPIAAGTGQGSPREVHDRQHYELVNWSPRRQRARTYRRFFAITELAALRVRGPGGLSRRRTRRSCVYPGRRRHPGSDHPDGCAIPAGYLRGCRGRGPTPGWSVEKILEPGEELPDWPVAGTTGTTRWRGGRAVRGSDRRGGFTALDTPADRPGAPTGRRWCTTPSSPRRPLLSAELGRLAAGRRRATSARSSPRLPRLLHLLPHYLPSTAGSWPRRGGRCGPAPELGPTVTALTPRLRRRRRAGIRFQQYTGAG